MSRVLPGVVLAALAVAGCEPREATVCALPDGLSCHDCLEGVYTCTYGDVSITQGDCFGECTPFDVYAALCAQGSEETLAVVDAGMVCERVGDPPPG